MNWKRRSLHSVPEYFMYEMKLLFKLFAGMFLSHYCSIGIPPANYIIDEIMRHRAAWMGDSVDFPTVALFATFD